MSSVIAIAGGEAHNVAVTSDGKVWTWGMLADGKRSSYPVPMEGLSSVTAVASRACHTLAVKSDGTAWTWGENYWGGAYKGYGKLGNGTKADQLVPTKVPGLEHVVQASGGDDFSAVLKSDGTVWTFGANGAGQLGNGDPKVAEHLSPGQVAGLKHVIYITARDFHAQAIKSDGTVWSWGSGVQGELGVPGTPLNVQQQFDLTGSCDRNTTRP